jgi:carbon storage regulator
MLVLTRKLEEKVKIGDHIYISILEIESGFVKIGIDAPKEVPIIRMELLDQVKDKNLASAAESVSDIARAATMFKHKFNAK